MGHRCAPHNCLVTAWHDLTSASSTLDLSLPIIPILPSTLHHHVPLPTFVHHPPAPPAMTCNCQQSRSNDRTHHQLHHCLMPCIDSLSPWVTTSYDILIPCQTNAVTTTTSFPTLRCFGCRSRHHSFDEHNCSLLLKTLEGL